MVVVTSTSPLSGFQGRAPERPGWGAWSPQCFTWRLGELGFGREEGECGSNNARNQPWLAWFIYLVYHKNWWWFWWIVFFWLFYPFDQMPDGLEKTTVHCANKRCGLKCCYNWDFTWFWLKNHTVYLGLMIDKKYLKMTHSFQVSTWFWFVFESNECWDLKSSSHLELD